MVGPFVKFGQKTDSSRRNIGFSTSLAGIVRQGPLEAASKERTLGGLSGIRCNGQAFNAEG